MSCLSWIRISCGITSKNLSNFLHGCTFYTRDTRETKWSKVKWMERKTFGKLLNHTTLFLRCVRKEGQQQPYVVVSFEFLLNSELKLCNGLCINGKMLCSSVLTADTASPLILMKCDEWSLFVSVCYRCWERRVWHQPLRLWHWKTCQFSLTFIWLQNPREKRTIIWFLSLFLLYMCVFISHTVHTVKERETPLSFKYFVYGSITVL